MAKSTFQTYSGYTGTYKELVQLEREEEMEQHRREISNMSPGERQAKGRALLDMKGRDEGQGLGGNHIVKFVSGEELPETEMSVGDLLMVSKNQPLNEDNPTGTITRKTNYSVSVAFRTRPQGFVYGKGLRLDLYVNDITFQRMLEAIDDLEEAEGQKQRFRQILLGHTGPRYADRDEITPHNSTLNSDQRQAVASSLSARDLHLIHGPPGTGKTTTLVEVIEQHVARGDQVLATAASNVAVDNLVDFLTARGRKVVRVGHPARVTETLRHHTLDYLIESRPKYQKARDLRDKIRELDDRQEQHTFPSGKSRRGLGNEKIKRLAEKGKSARGLSPGKIKSMARWIDLQERIGDLVDKARRLEDRAASELIGQAEVVCTTNSTAGSEIMQGRDFEVVAIDEATQATEPSCLISLLHGNKTVMAGDHRQLPPTILNQEAAQNGLQQTLFERMLDVHGECIKSMLTTQYRMNTHIMEFSSDQFYECKLQADELVADHILETVPEDDGPAGRLYRPRPVVAFLDTGGRAPERSKAGSPSRENRREAELVVEIVEQLVLGGAEPEEIGVISPYSDQVDLLSRKLREPGLEIKTVDGFQGREKDAIVLSFVRSNPRGQIGFLSDLRRLNVSITRARKKLVMIGDSDTLSGHPAYADLIAYVADRGEVIRRPDTEPMEQT